MNPVIIIPTYWTDAAHASGGYDHATLIDDPAPELERCLSSLENVRGVIRTCMILTAPGEVAAQARQRVDAIASAHPQLSPMVVGQAEAGRVLSAVADLAPTMPGDCLSLRGYGAIRNLGLAVAAILGHDVVVFLDDDELTLDDSFLLDAVYGLGNLTRQGEPIVAKSGYFLNAKGSCYADANVPWYDRHWNKNAEFNEWMRQAMTAPRISRSNHVCGGCMALHAEAFTRVAFDPFITRGEDTDYLINMRFYGLDVWFDNRWRVEHLPPGTVSPSQRFAQNVYRWIYERAKLQFAASIIGFNRVTSTSLMPYPGRWVSPAVDERAKKTALRRAVGTSEHAAYFDIWRHGIQEARRAAEENKSRYLAFQTWWPALMEALWDDRELSLELLSTAIPKELRELVAPEATAFIVGGGAGAALWSLSEPDEAIAEKDVDSEVASAVDAAVGDVASAVQGEVDAAVLGEAAVEGVATAEPGDAARPVAGAKRAESEDEA